MTEVAGLKLQEFTELNQMPRDKFRSMLWRGKLHLPSRADGSLSGWTRYRYADALSVEVSRQISDRNGITLEAAREIIVGSDAIRSFLNVRSVSTGSEWSDNPKADFWVGSVFFRNTWPAHKRRKTEVSSFGPTEFWSSDHFSGTIEFVTKEIERWIEHTAEQYPDADPARIFLVNVSAADRRLRRRAEQFGIRVIGNEFAVA